MNYKFRAETQSDVISFLGALDQANICIESAKWTVPEVEYIEVEICCRWRLFNEIPTLACLHGIAITFARLSSNRGNNRARPRLYRRAEGHKNTATA